MTPQLRASDFAAWRDSTLATTPDRLPVVLDVREPWELQTASIRAQGFDTLAVPMRSIPEQVAALDRKRPIACLCHHGMRSQYAAQLLERHGFADVVNLQGGIDAWSCELDPTVPRY